MTNIPPFYVGQKVVYITGINMPKGSVHVVSDIAIRPCGCCSIAINGGKFTAYQPPPGFHGFACQYCRSTVPFSYIVDNGRAWNHKSFRPLHEATVPLMTFSEIKEKEKTEILIPN